MRNGLVPILILSLGLAACGTTHHLDIQEDAERHRFNREFAHRGATVHLIDGAAHDARWVQIATDRVRWQPPFDGPIQSVPLEQVAAVRAFSRGAGARDGVVIGLLAGTMLGAGTFAAIESAHDPSDVGVSGAYGAAFGALAGLTLGPTIGAIVGHDDTYILTPADAGAGSQDARSRVSSPQ